MKLNKRYLILPVLAAGFLVGCNSPQKAITATPAPCVVTPTEEGVAALDIDFNIPDHYFSKRSRIIIVPTIVVGDSAVDEYSPLALDAPIYRKKTHRMEILDGYVDPYAEYVVKIDNSSKSHTVHYNDSIYVNDDADGGIILAVVSNDGCGQCSGIDTLAVATISYPPIIIDTDNLLRSAWIEPKFVVREKIHNGKGEARLQFVVNKSDIVMDMADNRAELTEMLNTLRPILSDSLTTVNSIDISGSASAEGSYRHNVNLANSRASSARNWLASELNLPRKARDLIRVGAAPEGWEPVIQAMIAADDPDSVKVREILIKHPGPTDDAAEPYIRRLACWPRILSNYLAKDRKVTYDYTWTVKSFTDDKEMLEIYKSRPDALNEEEFLRVASLVGEGEPRKAAYEKLLTFFPESTTARSNLAYLYVSEGHYDDAIALLAPLKGSTPEMQMILSAAYINNGNDTEAIEALTNVDDPQAKEVITLLEKRLRRKK